MSRIPKITRARAILLRVLRPLRNRYILAVVVFGFWMVFFDAYNLPSQNRVNKRMKRLELRKDWYAMQIAKLEAEQHRLLDSPQELERVARERYLLQRPNEDVYVIVRKD